MSSRNCCMNSGCMFIQQLLYEDISFTLRWSRQGFNTSLSGCTHSWGNSTLSEQLQTNQKALGNLQTSNQSENIKITLANVQVSCIFRLRLRYDGCKANVEVPQMGQKMAENGHLTSTKLIFNIYWIKRSSSYSGALLFILKHFGSVESAVAYVVFF